MIHTDFAIILRFILYNIIVDKTAFKALSGIIKVKALVGRYRVNHG